MNAEGDLDIWPPVRLNDFRGQTGPLPTSDLTFYITVARAFYHNLTIYGAAKALQEEDQFSITGSGRLPKALK